MNERDIIYGVLGGDTRRFEALVDRYLPAVRGLCASRVFNPSAHDDLVQETFIESYLRLDRLRNPDRFGPWLVAIARNKCREWLRQQGRRERLAERLAREAPSTVDPARESTRQELREWVRGSIGRLPEKLRDAMMLCYGEGLSTAEAAKCLGIRESALRKRLQYGREAIGAELMAKYREEVSPEDSERLRGKVLAAIPLSTVPWRSATLLSALVASKAVIVGLGTVVVLGLAAAVAQRVITQDGATATNKVGAPFPKEARLNAEATGSIEVTLRRVKGAEPLPRLAVKATPVRWDEKAWEKMLGAAGTPLRYKDLFAPSFRENATREELRGRWARQGLSASEIADAEKQLDAFWLRFTQGSLPPTTPNPVRLVSAMAHNLETGSNGTVAFADLPVGEYSVVAKGAFDQGTLLGSAFASVHKGEIVKVAIEVRELASQARVSEIRGQVIDAKSGKGIAAATVEVGTSQTFESSAFAIADSNGRFDLSTFTMPYGVLFARARLDKAQSSAVEFEHKEGEPANVEIPLALRGSISGRVTTADGRPAQKVPIMLKSVVGDTAHSVAYTDEDGRYSFVHDGGTLVLHADADSVESESAAVELAVDESRSVDFVLPGSASACFDVHFPDGSRPEKIRVQVFWYEEAEHSFVKELTRNTDSFVLPYLKPAAYRILIMGNGFEGQVAEFVVDETLNNLERTLQVRPARTDARVLLQDAQGKPVAKTRILAMWRYGRKFDSGEDTNTYSATSIAEVETGADGIAEFKGLPPARYDFHTDDALELHDIDVPCNRLLQIRKPADAPDTAVALEYYPFRLIDVAHEGSLLDLRDAGVFALTPVGKLSESGMEVGSNTVYIIKRGYTAGVCRVTVTPDQLDPKKRSPLKAVDVLLGAGGTVSGYIDCPDGGVAAGKDIGVFPADAWEAAYAAQVAEASEGNARAWEWARFGRILAQHAATADDGSFTLRFLPPGEYILAADTDKPGVLLVSEPVAVVAGKETAGVVLTERAPRR